MIRPVCGLVVDGADFNMYLRYMPNKRTKIVASLPREFLCYIISIEAAPYGLEPSPFSQSLLKNGWRSAFGKATRAFFRMLASLL